MADGRKKVKKVEIFQFFGDFFKVEVQKLNVWACLTRLIKPDTKKTLDIL
jgi:hypothetical protein